MSEESPESRPAPPPDPDEHPTRVLPPDSAPPSRGQRFVDRVWTFRALIAVALASVILGGLGGAALANAGSDDDSRRGGPFPGRMGTGPGGPMAPPGDRRNMMPRDGQRWHWNDGPQRRGTGQGQGEQGPGNPGVVPPTPAPTPTPKN